MYIFMTLSMVRYDDIGTRVYVCIYIYGYVCVYLYIWYVYIYIYMYIHIYMNNYILLGSFNTPDD